MSDELKRQLFQTIGQWIIVVVTGLIVYKDFAAFLQTGVLNALWQPGLQGIITVGGIWGLSKVGPAGATK